MRFMSAAYRALLPATLADAYDQLVQARCGQHVNLKSFDVRAPLCHQTAAHREIPDSFIAIKHRGERAALQGPMACFQHLVDLKALLGPEFPWYDPAKPGRPGFFVAGSFATPCWDFDVVKTTVYPKDATGQGFERTLDFHVPKGRGDVDFFIAGHGEGVDMAAEALVLRVLNPTERNPFMIAHDIVACAFCAAHVRRNIDGVVTAKGHALCLPCARGFGCSPDGNATLRNVYEFAAKHVIGLTIGPLKVDVVTRVYSSPTKCPALFDLTYDGGIYMGGDAVQFLDISLYQHDHAILLITPFSGASTKQEFRQLKKLEAYGLDLAVPGLKWDADMPLQARGLTVVRDVLKYRARSDADARSRAESTRVCGDVKTADDMSGQRRYAFAPGFAAFNIHHASACGKAVSTALLVDVPGSHELSGDFVSSSIAEFVKLWHMDIAPAAEAAIADFAQLWCTVIALAAAPAAAPGVWGGPCVAARPPGAFCSNVRQLIAGFDASAVEGASLVAFAPGAPGSQSIDVAFAFKLATVACAQVWNIDVQRLHAPIARCLSDTGIYERGAAVCLGAQTHFHSDHRIPLSLSAIVSILAQRPGRILAGTLKLVDLAGVQTPVSSIQAVLEAHTAALAELDNERWLVRFAVHAQ